MMFFRGEKNERSPVLISPPPLLPLANLFDNYQGPIMADLKEALGSPTKSYFI